MKESERSRPTRIAVRFTENEKKYIQYKADKANKSISDYMRSVAISGVVINTDTSKAAAVLTELNRIGNNINQIAKAVHTHGDYVSPDDIKSIREEFEAMKNIVIDKIINAMYEYGARLAEVEDKLVDVYVESESNGEYDEEEELSYLDEIANDLAELGFKIPNHDEEEERLIDSPKDFAELLKEEFGD